MELRLSFFSSFLLSAYADMLTAHVSRQRIFCQQHGENHHNAKQRLVGFITEGANRFMMSLAFVAFNWLFQPTPTRVGR